MTENEERWGENAQVTIEAVQQDFSENWPFSKSKKRRCRMKLGKKNFIRSFRAGR